MKPFPILFIVGPTAVGKTEIALLLAKKLSGEIISCDAMQVYREVNIASAKPSKQELDSVRHHCLNIVSVTEDFNVGRFREAATQAVLDIQQRGKPVIFCGGSGMYMMVLLDGIFEQLSRDPLLREKLQKEAILSGISSLHRKLSDLDPVVAGKIHPHDNKRIIRALEVCMTAGTAMSELQTQRQGLWNQMPIRIFAINRPREILYARVEDRVEAMFEQGLVKEVETISDLPLSTNSATLIGLREVGGYLRGEYDLAQAKYLMKMNTRHFVKRQLTWFRRDKRVEWINIENESAEDVVEGIMKQL
ncbi:MAG: tRNA (adenosine(37)-N6)-dimethylallyltransferase MiaA [Candidatus Omnitrophica bacterium]|nr:tRNA (adenosine(37)-N6)-dimethylallyltransferase MiaA [Candidatus Omnitrophota bacterium]